MCLIKISHSTGWFRNESNVYIIPIRKVFDLYVALLLFPQRHFRIEKSLPMHLELVKIILKNQILQINRLD